MASHAALKAREVSFKICLITAENYNIINYNYYYICLKRHQIHASLYEHLYWSNTTPIILYSWKLSVSRIYSTSSFPESFCCPSLKSPSRIEAPSSRTTCQRSLPLSIVTSLPFFMQSVEKSNVSLNLFTPQLPLVTPAWNSIYQK